MEESTSTDRIDAVDVVTGKAVQKIRTFTHNEWAKQIFEAIALVKPQLEHIGDFRALPAWTDDKSDQPPVFHRLSRQLHQAEITPRFGHLERVVLLEEFHTNGLQRQIYVFITQHGELRAVDAWTEMHGISEDLEMRRLLLKLPPIEAWPIQTEAELAKFLDLIEERYKGLTSPETRGRDYRYAYGNLGYWILDGIDRMITKQDELLAKRRAPFTESRETLDRWLDNLATVHNIRRT
jgi:hypothetical protein